MADEKSPEKPTVPFEAPPAWAIEMASKQAEGFAAVNRRLDTIETNVEIQGGTVLNLQKRLTLAEERAEKSSIPVKIARVTASDDDQNMTIAAIQTSVGAVQESLEENTKKTETAVLAAEQARAIASEVKADLVKNTEATKAQGLTLDKVYEDVKKSPWSGRLVAAFCVLLLAVLGAGTAYMQKLATEVEKRPVTIPAVTP